MRWRRREAYRLYIPYSTKIAHNNTSDSRDLALKFQSHPVEIVFDHDEVGFEAGANGLQADY